MSEKNPYATPKSSVNDVLEEGIGSINLFSSKGRLGRLRYFFYSLLAVILGMVLIGAFSSLFLLNDTLGAIGIGIAYIIMFIASFILTIQRCHDFNTSGWLSLLLFLPLVPLMFYFIPGTKGSNIYGKQTPPNTKGIIWGSILLPVALILLFMVISVAIPVLNKGG